MQGNYEKNRITPYWIKRNFFATLASDGPAVISIFSESGSQLKMQSTDQKYHKDLLEAGIPSPAFASKPDSAYSPRSPRSPRGLHQTKRPHLQQHAHAKLAKWFATSGSDEDPAYSPMTPPRKANNAYSPCELSQTKRPRLQQEHAHDTPPRTDAVFDAKLAKWFATSRSDEDPAYSPMTPPREANGCV